MQAGTPEAYGLLGLLDRSSTALTAAVYVAATVLFFAVFLAKGGQLFCWLAGLRVNVLERRDRTAFRVAYLFIMVLICVALGVDPIFGALLAGISVSRGDAAIVAKTGVAAEPNALAWDAIRRFSLAFFVPVYFAVVGLKLDLVNHFDLLFFSWLLLVACVVKGGSVWLGARLAGETRATSLDLAVALNARGGPGIVLATVTYAAGVINEEFFTALVVLSILTSQIAGAWLMRRFAQVRRSPSIETPIGPRAPDADASTGNSVPGEAITQE